MKSRKFPILGCAALLSLLGSIALSAMGCDGAPKVITINSCSPNPVFLHVKKSSRDKVVWKNNDSVAHTITFGTPSPFSTGVTTITVPSSGTSAVYTIDIGAGRGGHGYWIDCLSKISWAIDSTTAVTTTTATADSGSGPSVIVDD